MSNLFCRYYLLFINMYICVASAEHLRAFRSRGDNWMLHKDFPTRKYRNIAAVLLK